MIITRMVSRMVFSLLPVILLIASGQIVSVAVAQKPEIAIRLADAEDQVSALALSADGKIAAGAVSNPSDVRTGRYGPIVVWETATGRELRRFEVENGYVKTLALSLDGKMLAYAHWRGGSVWEIGTGKKIAELSESSNIDLALVFSPDGRKLAGAGSEKVILWDVANGRPLLSFIEKFPITGASIVFSPDGKVFATASNWDLNNSSKVVNLREIDTGKQLRTVEGFAPLAFSPDGRMLARMVNRGGGDFPRSEIALCDVTSGLDQGLIQFSGAVAEKLALTSDGQRLVCIDHNANVDLLEVKSGKRLQTIGEMREMVNSLELSQDGHLFAFVRQPGKVELRDISKELDKTVVAAVKPPQLIITSPNPNETLSQSQVEVMFGVVDQGGGLGEVRLYANERLVLREQKLTGPKLTRQRAVALKPGENLILVTASAADGVTVSRAEIKISYQPARPEKTRPELVVQTGHTASVKAVAYHPNGRMFASAGDDTTIKLWDRATGLEITTLSGHGDPVTTLAFSPYGNLLASGGGDRSIRVWDITTRQALHTFTDHSDGIECVAFDPRGGALAGLSFDRKVTVWDIDTGEKRATIELQKYDETHYGYRRTIAFSPDGRLLATPGERLGEWVVLYEIAGWRPVKTLYQGYSVAFSPDGKLVAASIDRRVYITDVATHKVLRAMEGHAKNVASIAFSPDGKLLASSADDNRIKFWEVTTGREAQELIGATDNDSSTVMSNHPNSIAFSPDGQTLVAGYDDNTVISWDVGSGRELNRIASPSSAGLALAFGDDGALHAAGSDRIVSVSRDGRVNASTIDKQNTGWRDLRFHHVTLNPKQGIVARAGAVGNALLLDLTGQKKLSTSQGHRSWIGAMVLSPDGNILAIGSYDTTIKLFDTKTGGFLREFKGTDVAHSLAFSPDGKILASGYGGGRKYTGDCDLCLDEATRKDNSIKLWDVITGKQLQTLAGHDGMVQALAFSSDGRLIASSGEDKVVKIWEAGAGKLLLNINTGVVSVLTFRHDSRGLITGGDNSKTIKIWDVATGRLEQTLSGHQQPVTALAVDHDGQRLASSDPSRTIVWDLKTGRQIAAVIPVDKSDYVIATAENYYLASKGAVKGVGFRLGDNILPFDQFDLRLNRPDIVWQRWGGVDERTIELYRAAWRKRVKRLGLDETSLGEDYELPEISILSEEQLEQKLTLKVRASDSRYLLDRILIYVNDAPVEGRSGRVLQGKRAQTVEESFQFDLIPGRNRVQVSALNEKGVESYRLTRDFYDPRPARPPDLYVLAVGVSKYADESHNLTYADKDAKDLIRFWKERQAGFGRIYTLPLTNQEATKTQILQGKQFLQQARAEDMVIVFLAGHGLLDKSGVYYFGTHDMDFNKPAELGLSYEALEDLLDGIAARRKLLLIDTCFSGEVDPDSKEIKVTGDDNQNRKNQSRSSDFAGELGVSASFQVLQEVFADLRRGSGAVVISAAGGAEYALELKELKNGVFTFALLNGLQTGEADLDFDGKIRISELRDYVSPKVQGLTRNRQRPVARHDNLEFDFTLAIRPDLAFIGSHQGEVSSVAFSPDGLTVASAGKDRVIRVWMKDTGAEILTLPGHSSAINTLAYHPREKLLASGGDDVKLWNLPNGNEVKKIEVLGLVYSIAFSPNGRLLAVPGEIVGKECTIKLLDIETGRESRTLTGHTKMVAALAFSPDGRQLVSSYEDGVIKFHEVSSGKEIRSVSLQGVAEWPWRMAFNPDGRSLAVTGKGNSVVIIEVGTGKTLRVIGEPEKKGDGIFCVSVSRDGKLLAAGGSDHNLRVWDYATGRLIGSPIKHGGTVTAVAFSPDGELIVTGSNDKLVRAWRTPREK